MEAPVDYDDDDMMCVCYEPLSIIFSLFSSSAHISTEEKK